MAKCALCQKSIGLTNYTTLGDLYFCNKEERKVYQKERQQALRVLEFLKFLNPNSYFT